MSQSSGLTAEMYRAIVAVVDERLKEVRVTRQDFDRLVAGQARLESRMDRVEAALDRVAQARARTDERLNQLAEAQAQSEVRLTALEAAVQRLAEAQAQSEVRLTAFEATMQRLAEAQARTEERLNQLAEAQAQSKVRLTALEAAVQRLAEAQARTEETVRQLVGTVGNMKGRLLELTYGDRPWAYFGSILRQVRAVSPVEIERELEAHLQPDELADLFRVDLLLRGQPRQLPDAPEVWLAVEISSTIDRYDVDWAVRRAGALRRAGLRAIAATAGDDVTEGASEEARRQRAVILRDGSVALWQEALAAALAA